MDWWRLPGPQRFVDEIANDLRGGRNVIVCLPLHVPSGLRTAVRSSLDQDIHWQSVPCSELRGGTPVDNVYEWLNLSHSAQELRTINTLLNHPNFGGYYLWFEEMDRERWSLWRDFLPEYANACRGMGILERTVFCIPLTGPGALEVPPEDVCLSIRRYEGYVSRLDMLVFARGQDTEAASSPVLDDLRVEIMAALAQWDAILAEIMAGKPLDLLLNCAEWLREVAWSRGWGSPIPSSFLEAWAMGIVNRNNGLSHLHSCACALHDIRELNRRLWKAQIRVLYPFLEEQRQLILERAKPFIKLPYMARNGELIDNIQNLELSHIEAVLDLKFKRFNRDLLDRISILRKIRNALAHMKTVDPAWLKTEAVLNPL
ncbi:MAG TPA: hypothetical protein PLX83_20105 [bacterium]|nr:hypothetical protein [bacterium]